MTVEADFSQEKLHDILNTYWGFSSFRPQQAEAVHAALVGQDALVVIPTGGGKSLCYQLPSMVKEGLTIVVSPLIALMDDQVAAANANGISAAALHSQRDDGERRTAVHMAQSGQLRLLYVSPERLAIGDLLPALLPNVCLIAIDEAHCVSHWGHDFRPEYTQLKQLFSTLPAHIPRMALTATATPMVQQEIQTHLGLRAPKCLIGHPDRPNLIYRALPRKSIPEQVQAVATRHPEGGGIVYALTRKEVEKVCGELVAVGIQADAYHAGLPAGTRRDVQRRFVAEEFAVVVATVAFGMGIDRSNVRWVVHAGCPRSLEHYQQESGRAGRDGLPAECVLLFGGSDLSTHRYFIDQDDPPPHRRQILEDQLKSMAHFASAPICRHRMICDYFGAAYPDPQLAHEHSDQGCGACDVCLGETTSMPTVQAEVLAKKIISAVWRTEGRFGINQVVAVLRGRNTAAIRRHGHENLSVYGLLKEYDDWTLRRWIDQLTVQGYLVQTRSDRFPLLGMTAQGKTFCRAGGEVSLSQGIEKSSTGKASRKKHDVDVEAWEGVDRDLFDVLRVMRSSIAKSDGVPPYIVFHDAALREIARAIPTQLEDLSEIKGIGEKKSERYGYTVIQTIEDYLQAKEKEAVE